MSDNYAEESQPLFKLLRTPAFRFVIVRYNHHSLLQQLKQDLQQKFHERPFLAIDTKQTDYPQFSQAYYQLGSGFLLLEQFDDALKQQANPEKRPDIEQNNQRRRDLCAGLNLRRDKLAQYPIALFVCMPASGDELYGKLIMEQMPDLWSFRSYMLDLQQVLVASEVAPAIEASPLLPASITPTREEADELNRLQRLIANTAAEETGYLRTLYPQLVEVAIEQGAYAIAQQALDDWQAIASEQDLARLNICRGDLSIITGDLVQALAAFEQALTSSQQQADRANEGVAYSRLGNTHAALGDLLQSLGFYEKFRELSEQLYQAYPSNVGFKNGLAIAYEKLGKTHAALGDLHQALGFSQKDAKLSEQLYQTYPSNVEFKNGLASSYSKLGETHAALGDFRHALGFYEKCRELSEQLYQSHPSNVGFKNGLAIAYYKLGQFNQYQLHDSAAALGYFQQAEALWLELVRDAPQYAEYQRNLQQVQQDLQNLSAHEPE